MTVIVKIGIAIVATLHLAFLWLEMFRWTTTAPKIFRGFSKDFFSVTRSLAANQGLYNGFLAAGLIWSLLVSNENWYSNIGVFFLSCTLVAGLYGALSVSKKIFWIQAFPSLVTLSLLLWSKYA